MASFTNLFWHTPALRVWNLAQQNCPVVQSFKWLTEVHVTSQSFSSTWCICNVQYYRDIHFENVVFNRKNNKHVKCYLMLHIVIQYALSNPSNRVAVKTSIADSSEA